VPSNSSERSHVGSWILTVTDLAVSVLAALSVERYSTTCVPLLDSVTPSAYGVQAPGVPPLVVMRYSVLLTPEAPVPASVAASVTLTERSYVSPVVGAAGSTVAVVVGAVVSQTYASGVTRK